MATLVAKSHIKFGSKGRPGPLGTVMGFEAGTRVAPGEKFECDSEMAKQFLEDGTAITVSEARTEERERMSAEERLREAEAEARDAGYDVSVSTRPADPALAAHREHQEAEENAVEKASKPQGRGRSR